MTMGTEKTDPRIFKPFGKPQITPFGVLLHGLKPVLQDARGRKILVLGIFNTVCTVILLVWCKTTNSIGLTAYTYLALFDILSLATCLLSLWVEQQKPNVVFTFGYERFEVLSVFASTILAQLSSLFIVKESLERFLQQPEIHLERFLPALALAFFCHLVVCYGMNNRAFNHVTAASGSSWLQEHVAEMSQSICHIIPGLSTFLLPRVNPFVLLGWTGGATLFASHLLIEVYNYSLADTIAAIFIAMMVCVTMFPMSVYSGRILLQTTPSYIIGQLDKCLREASTLDGVLEFRNECFWTLAFGDLSGTVHVRVRRDANEQLVLAHLVDRLSNLVSDLTIQVFKDEWAWSTTTLQVLNESALKFPSLAPSITSTISLTTRSPVTTGYPSLYGGNSQVQKIPPPQTLNPPSFSPTSWNQQFGFSSTYLSPASARQPLDVKTKNYSPSQGINPPPL
ncbi:zinc transporter 6-like isoform X2 [Limulus polyphemus]|uniref:Zinc transporter 6-like isoform X1 n=2 Tax=Limulus polyphemus TaxID=6850 RepID=A0ABM1TPM2_LIMPO|nr:zinc transporter 6-like isoform X1 [Limulus polyphemus]XP_022257828.1 zinc transporter 6-like isoform X2 [Limulus polyphemus]